MTSLRINAAKPLLASESVGFRVAVDFAGGPVVVVELVRVVIIVVVVVVVEVVEVVVVDDV